MECLFEFIMELFLEVGMEAGKSSKIPKYVRYPLIVIIILFFAAAIGLIFLAGIMALRENVFAGIFLILIGLLMFIMSAIKFRKIYLSRINKS